MQLSIAHFIGTLNQNSHVKLKFINHFFALSIASYYILIYHTPKVFRWSSHPKFYEVKNESVEDQGLLEDPLSLLPSHRHILSDPFLSSHNSRFSSSIFSRTFTLQSTFENSFQNNVESIVLKQIYPMKSGFGENKKNFYIYSSSLSASSASSNLDIPAESSKEEALQPSLETFVISKDDRISASWERTLPKERECPPLQLNEYIPARLEELSTANVPLIHHEKISSFPDPLIEKADTIFSSPGDDAALFAASLLSSSPTMPPSPPSLPPVISSIESTGTNMALENASHLSLQENEESMRVHPFSYGETYHLENRSIEKIDNTLSSQIDETVSLAASLLSSSPLMPPSPPSLPPVILTIESATEQNIVLESSHTLSLQEGEEAIKTKKILGLALVSNNPVIQLAFTLEETLTNIEEKITTPIISPLSISKGPPLKSWETYNRSSLNPLLREWLMKLATNPAKTPPEEIPFRQALVNTLLSSEFQPFVNLDWEEEEEDEQIKKRREAFCHAYMKAVDWPVTRFKRLFLTDEANMHKVKLKAWLHAYDFPLKLGVRVYRNEDFKHEER